MWKNLHAAAFYTPGSPHHGASRRHWGQLVRLARPACSQRTAARAHRANRPIQNSPALALECRGSFCSALIGGMPERHFPFPHQLPQKVENSPCTCFCRAQAVCSPTRSFPAYRCKGRSAGQTAPSKNPRHSLWNAGDFLFRSDGRHAVGVLPLSTAAAAKGGQLSPMRAFAGRRRSAHLPALFRRTAARERTAPGKLPPSENPRHSLWNAGDFLSIYSCCTGVTSARRSHGLPL